MINETTVCVSNYNKDVFDYFKKHKIDPIIVPLRHRFFWDGGLHCCSVDLVREGDQQSYIKLLSLANLISVADKFISASATNE